MKVSNLSVSQSECVKEISLSVNGNPESERKSLVRVRKLTVRVNVKLQKSVEIIMRR